MEAITTIEIELPISFTATKGYPATRWEPGEPDQIDDIDWKTEEAKKAINTAIEKALEDGWLYEELLQQAADEALDAQLQKEDYEFEVWKDKQRGIE